jgi:hypothetical protein
MNYKFFKIININMIYAVEDGIKYKQPHRNDWDLDN